MPDQDQIDLMFINMLDGYLDGKYNLCSGFYDRELMVTALYCAFLRGKEATFTIPSRYDAVVFEGSIVLRGLVPQRDDSPYYQSYRVTHHTLTMGTIGEIRLRNLYQVAGVNYLIDVHRAECADGIPLTWDRIRASLADRVTEEYKFYKL